MVQRRPITGRRFNYWGALHALRVPKKKNPIDFADGKKCGATITARMPLGDGTKARLVAGEPPRQTCCHGSGGTRPHSRSLSAVSLEEL
jgi:hypothetical protein